MKPNDNRTYPAPSLVRNSRNDYGQIQVAAPLAYPTRGRIADAANPIARGKVIVIYCEGLGAVSPPTVAGQAAPVSPLAMVQSPVTVTVGGVNAAVLFAGLTPGLSGLYQINAVVPDSVVPGSAVPVVVTTAGASSEAVTIGVR